MRRQLPFCALVLISLLATGTLALRMIPSAARPASENASPSFDELIDEYARRYGVDPALVKAVVHVESGFRERARSRRGARGLMQLMPRTGRAYGARDLDDPRENLRAGIRHLRYLLDRHANDPRLALAAYNAGSAVVRRYGGVPPYPETRRYVARVLHYFDRYSAQTTIAERVDGAPSRG